LNWMYKSAFIIDASLPKTEVISQVKTLIWSHL
jgi:hypothetical protein